MKKCIYMEVKGARSKGRPRKTWLEVVKNDLKSLGLQVGCSGLSCLEEEDCGRYVLTQVCLELPWDSSQVSRL